MGEKVVEVFGMVREIPHVVDGIGCHCGCSTQEGYYSLLTCFHEDGRAASFEFRSREDELIMRGERVE